MGEADEQYSSYRCPKCVANNVEIVLQTIRRPGRPRTNTAPTGSLSIGISKKKEKKANKDKRRKVSVPKRRSVRIVATKRKRNVQIWPCGVCDQNVRKIRSVYCNACKKYCHFTRCSGLKSQEQILALC